MAGFNTHLGGGIAVGIASTTFFSSTTYLSSWQSLCLVSLACLGGLVPDLDSDTGRPAKLLFAVVTLLTISFVFIHFASIGLNIMSSIGYTFIAAIICLMIFLVAKRLTVHRGIMHSIPFILTISLLVAIATKPWGHRESVYAGVTFFLGGSSHLLLDELNSIGVKYGVVPYLKKSFGSALKFKSNSIVSTATVYIALTVLSITCFVNI